MPLEARACYRALRARDRRFDGAFFVGVSTTGIYCRPICPARTPAQARCTFYGTAAEAERAGFRACFRCRPELAPGQASTDATSRLVKVAAEHIQRGYLNDHSVEDLAGLLGVTDRHLRRVFEAELGVSTHEFAATRRLGLAKQLLQDTDLPLSSVAFAAGFGSVRRFNDAFLRGFGRAPSAFPRGRTSGDDGHFTLRLDFRPPFHWDAMRSHFELRAVPGVESVEDGVYRRSVSLGTNAGVLALRRDDHRPSLHLSVPVAFAKVLMEMVARVRAMVDLDAPSHVIDAELRRDPRLRPSVRLHPGLRVPGAFDGFELAVRAVLGQQVSVAAAATLAGRLAAKFGTPLLAPSHGVVTLFPPAATLAAASPLAVAALGIPRSRAGTVVALANAVLAGRVNVGGGATAEELSDQLKSVPGIGPWTAAYVAMRGLRMPDAFPAGDLVLRRALGAPTDGAAERAAEGWRPWRAYAVMHLWASETAAEGRRKTARKKGKGNP